MTDLSPNEVFEFLAKNLPSDTSENIIVVGSLAAAYHFLRDRGYDVRTKDVDCVVRPRNSATIVSRDVAVSWLESGWVRRTHGGFGQPRPTAEPTDLLSVIRLQPHEAKGYFVEFLTVGESEHAAPKSIVPVEFPNGEYFALASFKFLRLIEHEPLRSHVGIQ